MSHADASRAAHLRGFWTSCPATVFKLPKSPLCWLIELGLRVPACRAPFEVNILPLARPFAICLGLPEWPSCGPLCRLCREKEAEKGDELGLWNAVSRMKELGDYGTPCFSFADTVNKGVGSLNEADVHSRAHGSGSPTNPGEPGELGQDCRTTAEMTFCFMIS